MPDRTHVKLLPEEKVLIEANDGILTLTTHRVRLDQRASGKSRLIGITLDAVASCGLVTRSLPLLLVVAGLIALFGFVQLTQRSGTDTGAVLLLVAAAFVAAYFFTRSSVLAVASAGETISVAVKGMSRDAIVDFVETLERAKLDRLHAKR